MASNATKIPRKPVPPHQDCTSHPPRDASSKPGLTWPYLATSILVLLVATLSWARRWALSGAAIESLIVVYGHGRDNRVLPSIPLWTFLATFNLVYAICSTSWLLYAGFALACYPSILLTCLFQFRIAARLARRVLRKTLGQHPSFVRDQLALFNLPALEIDTDVDGLMVIRGATFSCSGLTLVAHGIELGLKLTDDIELAIYVDEVVVRFFRAIEIGDVYANIKGGKFEMTFAEMDDVQDDAASEISVFLDNTPLLRAANIGGKKYTDRPKLRETLTGVSWLADSSAQVRRLSDSSGVDRDGWQAGLDMVTTLSPDDQVADTQYQERLTEIRTTSAIYQSRQQARHKAKQERGVRIDDENEMRAAASAELHDLPSVPHPPSRSVRVTTLQNLSSPRTREFMHRLPFLLRLLLAPLSYFHPIRISSINAAGSGKWLSSMLQKQVFKRYTENNAELRRLQRKVASWTADANFCVQLLDIKGVATVPLSTLSTITAFLKFDEVIAYRIIPHSSTISQVVRLGGADASFTIPSFLLPHHEHIIPPAPTPADEEALESAIQHEEGTTPKAKQHEAALAKLQRDETEIVMSVHGSLPASFDQSLLNFTAALVKSTKIIEFEKDLDEATADNDDNNSSSPVISPPSSSLPIDTTTSDTESISSITPSERMRVRDAAGFKVFAKHIRQNLSDGTTKAQMKEFARDLHQSTKDGMKKALVGGLVNDRWIARMTGKVAAALQDAQGDFGYSGRIPIALGPYRGREGLASKLLP
ncbi:hypothetical protein EJ05DRAFT_480009 [Pseudovirgaria hyperparasitica]|uniref:Uncharacterized protein n=1 Tax=Pseudovirgaria hyperparasitica TaxID=470096 RepID=A0A6A6VV00_9PEZI|nr:uncharacterized protein EJ05DRAFT_480009 [Pseudovirgaria hyperparasitica]KAF2753995.1 hypothetical protein EJ05DRAFT_480009 [Pseudovirgaria hyperparasitica]